MLFYMVQENKRRKERVAMFKVILVDDEILALEYLQKCINWEENGFEVVGSATGGEGALKLYEQYRADIVISDICMIGMDGLELAMKLKKKNPEVEVILLSAYRDFDYAQKGIQYGVSNYLLKRELSNNSLLEELNLVAVKLEENKKKKKAYQQSFMKQLIYNRADTSGFVETRFGKRLFLLMIHKNNYYENGKVCMSAWGSSELNTLTEVIMTSLGDGIHYEAEVQITSNNIMLMYRIEKQTSKYIINSNIERKCSLIVKKLQEIEGCRFNLLYTLEIKQSEISIEFQKMSRQIRYAVFWEKNIAYCLPSLPEIIEENKINWQQVSNELKGILYSSEEEMIAFLNYMFGMTKSPSYRMETLNQFVLILDNLLIELEEEGIRVLEEKEVAYKIDEIAKHYIKKFLCIQKTIVQKDSDKYSEIVLKIQKYIRRNYRNELSLEVLGHFFDMNGVYLGQILKKETGVTFLKYLTNCRMEEAKKLLEEGEYNINEIAELVGYKTSQYFSQIFTKQVGVNPQEYKKWRGNI